MRLVIICALISELLLMGCATGVDVPSADYVPDAEIELLIGEAIQNDTAVAKKAIERLREKGAAAEQALTWHLYKESPAKKPRYAEALARCGNGRVAYRVSLDLLPDGSGALKLWSDRALLAECGKRYSRLMGEPEPVYSEDELRRSPYSKVELIRYLDDGIKFIEQNMGSHSNPFEASGILSFKNFDSLSHFAEGFDSHGFHLLAGATLWDEQPGLRTFQSKASDQRDCALKATDMLHFSNIKWEFVLDFNGTVKKSNAARTEGSKLIWTFDCAQMLNGEALVEATFDVAGAAPRAMQRKDASTHHPAPQAKPAIAGASAISDFGFSPGKSVRMQCEGESSYQAANANLSMARNVLIEQSDANGQTTISIAADKAQVILDAQPEGNGKVITGKPKMLECEGRVEIKTSTHTALCDRCTFDLNANTFVLEMSHVIDDVRFYAKDEGSGGLAFLIERSLSVNVNRNEFKPAKGIRYTPWPVVIPTNRQAPAQVK